MLEGFLAQHFSFLIGEEAQRSAETTALCRKSSSGR
jgi:hypothetical protein